jgi:hypothetical protein
MPQGDWSGEKLLWAIALILKGKHWGKDFIYLPLNEKEKRALES